MTTTYDMTALEGADLCAKCKGWCCKHIRFPVEYVNPRFLYTRGIKFAGTETGYSVLVEQECQHITDTGCALGIDKPVDCILYPYDTHPLERSHCELMRKMYPDAGAPDPVVE